MKHKHIIKLIHFIITNICRDITGDEDEFSTRPGVQNSGGI